MKNEVKKAAKEYGYFLNALKGFIKVYNRKNGRGAQKYLAVVTGMTDGFVSQLIADKATKRAGFDHQVALAKAAGYEYIDFLIDGMGDAGARIRSSNDMKLIAELEKRIKYLEGQLAVYEKLSSNHNQTGGSPFGIGEDPDTQAING